MIKFVQGWKPVQSDTDIYPPVSEEMKKIARLSHEVHCLRSRLSNMENSRDVWKRKAKKFEAENKLLREPFVAAMTVAQEQNDHQ